MSIRDYEYYHGAVLTKIVKSDMPTTLRLIETNITEASVYKINDEAVIFIKYSATPRVATLQNVKWWRWSFNLYSNHINSIKRLFKDYNHLNLVFVCGHKDLATMPMEICVIEKNEIPYIIDLKAENTQTITVSYSPNKRLHVNGPASSSVLKIPAKRIEKPNIPG